MSKIKTLKLSNFKFFRKEEIIDLEGKNLLLYGENGSGKSSIFWGLYTLLEASLKTPAKTDEYFKPFNQSSESLINIYADEAFCDLNNKTHYNSYVEIEDDNGTINHISLLDSSICGNDDVKESRKATDFINYQSIFKFQEFRNSEEPNLYEVFNYSILPYVNFASFTLRGNVLSNAYDMWVAYQNGPGTTTNRRGDTIQVYKHSADYQNFQKFELHFNAEFQRLIDFINSNSLELIKKLGYNIEFKLEYKEPSHRKKDKEIESTPFRIGFKITKYNNRTIEINRPQTFLNEAKMAAVATSIRFSILKYRINSVAPQALKALVLDDMMISLDMSNRDCLIDLILGDFSDSYQILFLTHDKTLYNFVYYKIKQKSQSSFWKLKEMYVGESDITEQELPVVISGECGSFEKAEKYYKAKDFTTSSIYIRQTIEKILSDAVPEEIRRKIDKDMKDKFIPLEYIWQQVKTRYSIPLDIQELFAQSKLMILNPAAHNQKLSQPIYRRELLDSFELVKKLQELNLGFKELLIEKEKKLIFKHPTENYTFEFELKTDMIKSIGEINDPKCVIHTWQYNETDFYNFKTGGVDPSYSETNPKFSRLKSSLFSLTPLLPIDEDCFLDNTFIENFPLRKILF